MSKFKLRALAPLTAALLIGAACNAVTEDDPNVAGGTTGSTSANGSGGGDAAAGGGATTGAGGEGGIFNPVGSGGNGAGGDETCLSTSAEAQKKQLDMVIVWDRSGSMSGSSWNGTVSAVTQFVNDSASAGVNVGINFFPLDGASDQCDQAIHNPPQVPLTELPMGASTLVSAINGTSPGGSTPTYSALFGTLQYLTAYQTANPDHVVIAVLASDGDPTQCNTSGSEIAALAQSAFGFNGVRTYAVAIQGATVSALNQIAAAGGTGQAFDVTTDISLFKQKMEEIRASALGCEYDIPEPGDGEEFDPQKLNVIYTPGGTTIEDVLPRATDEADCAGGPGWYYDNPAAPTKIFLCPASCATITADTEALVNFQFGCPTILN